MTEAPTRPPGRLRWPILTALAAVVLVAVVILLVGRKPRPTAGWNRPLEPVALVNEVRGTARALRGTQPRLLAPGETVYTGESLETEPGASLSLTTYPGEARLGLGEAAAITFETPAEVSLARGRLQAKVPDSVVQVFITPHGRVVTRETKLSLEVRAEGTQLAVSEGDARVESARGLRQVVAAGATLLLPRQPPARD